MRKVLKLFRSGNYAEFSSQSYCKYKTTTRKTIASCKWKFTSQGTLYWADPIPSSIRARNAQGINITNCDVTTWSWVNLVNPGQSVQTYFSLPLAPPTGNKEKYGWLARLASFPGLPRLQFLIACSMQKRREKAWWILPRDPRHTWRHRF